MIKRYTTCKRVCTDIEAVFIKQLDLFGKPRKLPAKKHGKPKYLNSHLSYRQRLRLLTGTKYMTAKQAKEMYSVGIYLTKYNRLPRIAKRPSRSSNRPTKRGHRFVRTVDQSQLSKAVYAMCLRKQGNYKLSINKICKRFKISKPSLYRGFRKKYGK